MTTAKKVSLSWGAKMRKMKVTKRPRKSKKVKAIVAKGDPRPLFEGESRCTKCGCTDSFACSTGCSWVTVDRKKRTGICSNCAPLPMFTRRTDRDI